MIEPIQKDGFFENPDKIRKYALTQTYYSSDNDPNDANYPGHRTDFLSAINHELFKEFAENLYEVIGLEPQHSSFIHSFFQYTTEADGNSWVHRDNLYFNPTHVGLVYLTPNPPTDSGTILYTPKDMGEYDKDHMKNSGDVADYDVKHTFDNAYNRVVVYDPQEFHKSDKYFGDNRFDSRLFIVFFMRVD